VERAPGSTNARLLEGAAGLFREKGFDGTTTRELSNLIGVQKASLYYHIESKEDLLYKLCVLTLQDVEATFEECLGLGKDPLGTLEAIIESYTKLILRDRDRHATMLIEMRSLTEAHRKEVIRTRDRNVALVQGLIEEAQNAGSLKREISSKYYVLALFNLLNWSIFWYSADGEATPEEIARLLESVFFDGARA
jgi:TetR/AcrR family transcriptional regulator, cholesterol catabolism regulator